MIEKTLDPFRIENHFQETEHIPSSPIFQNQLAESPRFTIAIPTYLRAKYLKEALESAINQETDIPYEIIVVDNNPERNDETEQMMNCYSHHANISYYKNTCNLGMIGNWNRLFVLSRTPYIIMLHDDDALSCNYLEIIDAVINNCGTLGIIQTGKTKDIKQLIKNVSFNKLSFKRLTLRDFIFQFRGGAPTGTTFNKEKVIELGGFDSAFFPSSDYSFFTLMASFYPIFFTSGKLTYYRWSINESQKVEVRRDMILKDIIIQQSIKDRLETRPRWFYKRFFSSMLSVRNQRGRKISPQFQPLDPRRFNLFPSNKVWDFFYRLSTRFFK